MTRNHCSVTHDDILLLRLFIHIKRGDVKNDTKQQFPFDFNCSSRKLIFFIKKITIGVSQWYYFDYDRLSRNGLSMDTGVPKGRHYLYMELITLLNMLYHKVASILEKVENNTAQNTSVFSWYMKPITDMTKTVLRVGFEQNCIDN